ncbi:MAG: hypothetical protein L6V93_15655 [Clostridiales bacterium]|nr:MAG: hypothetical protein L6V93_15655 [Clostridiales bacterium]
MIFACQIRRISKPTKLKKLDKTVKNYEPKSALDGGKRRNFYFTEKSSRTLKFFS